MAAKRASRKRPAATRATKPPKRSSSSSSSSSSRRRRRGGTVALPTARVRMYRQGLGDCFLLTLFPAREGDETDADVEANAKHILIDCGSLGAKTTGNKMRDIVSHIEQTTHGKLSALVATHEHWDHVSGFSGQQRVFKAFDVDEVWLAWTEDPRDELAQRVARIKEDLGAALGAAAALLTAPGVTGEAREVGLTVRSLLGFTGPQGDAGVGDGAADRDGGDRDEGDHEPGDAAGAAGAAPMLGAAELKETLDAAMAFVRTGYADADVSYFKPGQTIEPDWLPGFRFYVLGPPRSEDALADLGDHGSSELYGMASGLRSATQFHLAGDSLTAYAAKNAATGESDVVMQELPFDVTVRVERTDDRVTEWFEESYFAPAHDWRRIDRDWLLGSADLALQLDNMTNNTSLVLALERIADGKVLLLAGDAQQGNWLSWHDGPHGAGPTWTAADETGGGGRGPRTITAADLLSRTVFYKVGHHGSHNATASTHGLELMRREDELTAFIPVDRQVALSRNPKDSWRMPAERLYRVLLEKCQGRVVRSDTGWAAPAEEAALPDVERAFAGLATDEEWAAWKRAQQIASPAAVPEGETKRVDIQPLFVDFNLR